MVVHVPYVLHELKGHVLRVMLKDETGLILLVTAVAHCDR